MQTISAAISYLKLDSWIVQAFVVVFFTLLLNFFLKKILIKVHARLTKTKTYWDDAFIDAILSPLTLLIWVLGLTFAAEIVRVETDTPYFW